jgi:signal transduction histidine kinase
MDAAVPTCRYVDQVERVPVAVRLSRLWERLRRTSPWVIDGLIASTLMVVSVAALWWTDESGSDYSEPSAGAVAIAVVGVVPYYFRRRAPLFVLITAAVPLVTLSGLEYRVDGLAQGLVIATYTVGAYCEGRRRAIGAAWVAAGLVAALVTSADFDAADLFFNGAVYAAAFLFGVAVQSRRLYTQQVEERAALLERERDEEARRAVADERLRIAQELHDVVAHSMGVIAVQAGVGAHVIETDPDEAKRSLEAIARTSRSTLTEIRRMLGVLREDDGAQYTPAPGLADLDRLVREVAGAGVDVDVRVDGDPVELPPGVDFTAYRIVQEALTNVLKHAGPARVEVRIGYETDALALEVADDGRGVNGRSAGEGHGLVGMRERVAVYGGVFEAGPQPGGGFRVRVLLPYGVTA